jgi:hypothetical protein
MNERPSYFHQGPAMVQFMTPGLSSEARDMVKNGVDIVNVQALRHVALQRVFSNPGQRAQIPIPPEQSGYVVSMSRLPPPNPKILIKVVKS